MYEYRAKVIRVIDGDTVDFEVDLGFNVKIGIRTRLAGVDTPERGHEDWSRATAACKSLLLEQQDSEGYVKIKTSKTGKYGRWITEIAGVTDQLAKVWPYGG